MRVCRASANISFRRTASRAADDAARPPGFVLRLASGLGVRLGFGVGRLVLGGGRHRIEGIVVPVPGAGRGRRFLRRRRADPCWCRPSRTAAAPSAARLLSWPPRRARASAPAPTRPASASATPARRGHRHDAPHDHGQAFHCQLSSSRVYALATRLHRTSRQRRIRTRAGTPRSGSPGSRASQRLDDPAKAIRPNGLRPHHDHPVEIGRPVPIPILLIVLEEHHQEELPRRGCGTTASHEDQRNGCQTSDRRAGHGSTADSRASRPATDAPPQQRNTVPPATAAEPRKGPRDGRDRTGPEGPGSNLQLAQLGDGQGQPRFGDVQRLGPVLESPATTVSIQTAVVVPMARAENRNVSVSTISSALPASPLPCRLPPKGGSYEEGVTPSLLRYSSRRFRGATSISTDRVGDHRPSRRRANPGFAKWTRSAPRTAGIPGLQPQRHPHPANPRADRRRIGCRPLPHHGPSVSSAAVSSTSWPGRTQRRHQRALVRAVGGIQAVGFPAWRLRPHRRLGRSPVPHPQRHNIVQRAADPWRRRRRRGAPAPTRRTRMIGIRRRGLACRPGTGRTDRCRGAGR